MTVTAIAPAQAGVDVGSFFARSWGYDQTNVNFYRVVGLTAKGVRLQEWSVATVRDDGHGPVTHVVPGDGPRVSNEWPKNDQIVLAACGDCRSRTEANYGPASTYTYAAHDCPDHGPRPTEAPILTKRLSSYDAKSAYVAVGPYNDHAYLWDGSPMYQTASGWGH